jgi:hypothetical protein
MPTKLSTEVINIKRRPELVDQAKREGRYQYIGRGSPYANDWTHLPLERTKAKYQVRTRAESITAHEQDLRQRLERGEPGLREKILALEGQVLGCFCRPLPCHGITYIKLIEELKHAATEGLSVEFV